MNASMHGFMSVFMVGASTKGGWSVFGSVGMVFTCVFRRIVEMSHRCARGEYLCVCVRVCVRVWGAFPVWEERQHCF